MNSTERMGLPPLLLGVGRKTLLVKYWGEPQFHASHRESDPRGSVSLGRVSREDRSWVAGDGWRWRPF